MKYKFFYLALFAGMLYTTAFAQVTIKHQKTVGGSDLDAFSAMYLTYDGGLIAGGYSYSGISGEKTENNRGDYDYWVVKFDSLGKIQWDKTIGGSEEDVLRSIQQTHDGGYIVGGTSYSNISGEKTENNRGGSTAYPDYWIVKLDSLGKIEWDKTIGGSFPDGFGSLQQTFDEGYIVGGYSSSNISGEKTENSRSGSADYWIIKLDSLGKIQWDKTIGGSDYDYLSSLQQTSDGGYILGGYSWSNISAEKTETSRGGDDYWVVKLNKFGNIQWDKTMGGSDLDMLESLQQTSDGGYILGGASESDISGEKTENSRGIDDYWIVKLSSTGQIKWDKTIGGNGTDHLSALQQTDDGGYILGGYSFSNISGEKTENSRGLNDYWLVKLNNQGIIQWDKTVGGDHHDFLTCLQQTSDEGYILGGGSSSNASYEKTENRKRGEDYWVVKLNNQGKIQWDKTIGGNSQDALNSIKEIEKNRYALGGQSGSKISFDKTQPGRGDYDYWIVELKYIKEDSTAVTTLPNTNNLKVSGSSTNKQFTVYPNPAKDILYVQTNGKAMFTLTNQSGKILLTKTINNKDEINVANLGAGLYYLKNNATSEVKKVFITK